MMADVILSDAGWFFFALWSVVLGAVSLKAFAGDLLPSRAQATAPGMDPSGQNSPRNSSGLD